jgi:hypothetical protein
LFGLAPGRILQAEAMKAIATVTTVGASGLRLVGESDRC